MKTFLSVLILLLVGMPSCTQVPRLFRENQFTAADLAEAVNHYVALGESAAVKELTALTSRKYEDGYVEDASGRFYRRDRVGWVCRILFLPKGNQALRGPRYGALLLPFLSMPDNRWPLYPVAASGNSFFVLSEGYILGGAPEDPKKYLSHCRAEGFFRKQPVPVPTRAQARKDVRALRLSPAWRAIKWKDKRSYASYTMHEEWTWRFIQAQADMIP